MNKAYNLIYEYWNAFISVLGLIQFYNIVLVNCRQFSRERYFKSQPMLTQNLSNDFSQQKTCYHYIYSNSSKKILNWS